MIIDVCALCDVHEENFDRPRRFVVADVARVGIDQVGVRRSVFFEAIKEAFARFFVVTDEAVGVAVERIVWRHEHVVSLDWAPVERATARTQAVTKRARRSTEKTSKIGDVASSRVGVGGDPSKHLRFVWRKHRWRTRSERD